MSRGYQQEKVIDGVPLSAGIAIARTCRFNENRHSNLDIYKVADGKGVEREIARVKKAAAIAVERIEIIRAETAQKIGPAEAEIFVAQQLIIKDPVLLKSICDLIIREHTNAEAAVMVILDSYEAKMRRIENDYLRERASDFIEIKNRLLDVLRNMNPVFQCAEKGHCQRGKNRIVVVEDLTPGLTMEIDTAHTLGFITERGGLNSHAAILARSMGIPAVSGIPDIHESITCGTEVLIDGNTGRVILWPSDKTVKEFNAVTAGRVRVPHAVEPLPDFKVMANISLSQDVVDAMEMRADGVGLYRTEFEFMNADRFLDEDDQCKIYSSVVAAMKGLPVTVRLFDAGGDKPLSFLEIPPEENPALGWRGGRLLLGHSLMLRTQARALARASVYGPIRVLYPMIVDLEQFVKLRKLFEESIGGLKTGKLTHGVMFEVPSSCLEASAIMKVADFGSIGTNDLVQYLFAVDRNNAKVAYDYSPDKPVFWKVIKSVAVAGRKAGKDISICGEVAGDPEYIRKVIAAGIKSVSVSPRLISGARHAALQVLRGLNKNK